MIFNEYNKHICTFCLNMFYVSLLFLIKRICIITYFQLYKFYGVITIIIKTKQNTVYLIAVCNTSHTGHNSQHIIVGSINTDLSSCGSTDSCGGKNELKGGVINTGEVATTRRLVFLRAKSE